MKLFTMLLIVVCGSLRAEFVVVAKDGNGEIVGVPLGAPAGNSLFQIMTVNGHRMSTNVSGQLPNTVASFFESNNCTGPAYVSTWEYVAPRLEMVGNTAHSPRLVVLLPPIATGIEVSINSLHAGFNCQPYNDPIQDVLVPIAEVVVDDPSSLGLQYSESSSSWGFPPPLLFEVLNLNLISSSGFESAPKPQDSQQ